MFLSFRGLEGGDGGEMGVLGKKKKGWFYKLWST